MKNTKIVKRISALALAGAMGISIVSCAKKSNVNNQETIYDENGNIIVVQDEALTETGATTTGNETEKKVGKIGVYDPVDFKTITDYNAKYEELLVSRKKYNDTMNSVWKTRVLYSDEEVAAAIYNVVRIDNDLASLMSKISEQKRKNIKKEDIETQIEMFENLLKDMKELQQAIAESEAVWSADLDKISKAQVDKIEKVKNYNNMALQAPIKMVEKDLNKLKAELASINTAGL